MSHARIFCQKMDVNPVDVFVALSHCPYVLFLDSADQSHPDSRYSFVMADPVEVLTIQAGAVYVDGVMLDQGSDFCPFTLVQERLEHYTACLYCDDVCMIHDPCAPQVEDGISQFQDLKNDIPPFRGGAAGLFGYDLGRYVEDLPSNAASNPTWPDMAIGIYDRVYAYDHKAKCGYMIVHAVDQDVACMKLLQFQSAMRDFCDVGCEDRGVSDAPCANKPLPIIKNWQSNFDQSSYENIIAQTIEYIRAGDIFQANITRRLDAPLPENFDTVRHYLALRAVNSAPFAGYFDAGSVVVSSASPERFVTLGRDGRVETKPIKGTRPRFVDDTMRDLAEREALISSAKDRAENTMIVDLLRNDLSKTCLPDSIEVPHLCALESFASVHHLVSTVTGTLAEGKTALDLLRGCFPGGSITGAPKIRAMEIIDVLEPTRRGPYCGALGYIGVDGVMDTNILIRTAVFDDKSVCFQVGGGIVIESDPSAEYAETQTKAYGVLKSFY